ncbi:MAG TPA: hypothetical protein VFE47_00710 [Tepidisphaeraceae bacterium]|jgi:hypothetical protein|nr:hypothetical protein [Tepidisphaeraceae bacterium]
MKNTFGGSAIGLVTLLAALAFTGSRATADDATAPADSRYGPFGLLDSRSLYGKGVFPEPFIVDDSDGEVNEFRIDWSHQGGKGQNLNVTTVELEHGNGLWTLELEVPYEYDTSNTYDPATGLVDHSRVQGFDNINPGARMPFYQYVTSDEFVDTTFGAAIEVGVPSNSPLGKNTEIVPKIFNDTRIGEHFTMQSIIGWSFLRGSQASGGGEQHLEYGLTLGWTIPHNELPLPYVQDFIPVFEIQGETLMNTHAGGEDDIVANFAFRANLFSIGRIQPRLGVGYLLPLDKAKGDFDWGIYTSLVFEF